MEYETEKVSGMCSIPKQHSDTAAHILCLLGECSLVYTPPSCINENTRFTSNKSNGILLLARYPPCSPLPTQSCRGLPMLRLLQGSISCGQCAEECCHANGHTREVRIKGHNPEVCHSFCNFVLRQLTSSLALQDAPCSSRSSTNSLLSCTAARCRAVRPSYREGQCQSTLKGLYTVSLP